MTVTFFRDLVKGSDSELADAYNTVRKAIDRLSQANGFRAVANTQDLLKLMGDLDMKLDLHHQEVMMVFADQREDIESLVQLSDQQVDRLEAIDRMLKEMKSNAEAKNPGAVPPSSNPAMEYAGNNLVNYFFRTVTNPLIQYREIENFFVIGTCKWILTHDLYLAWQDGKFPFLWISGEAGIGKSFAAYAVLDAMKKHLENSPAPKIFAYYFFRDERVETRSVTNALHCIIRQVAAADSKYCERVATQLAHLSAYDQEQSLPELWDRYLASKFGGKSETELYLVLDGLDEADASERSQLFEVFEEIRTRRLKIHVILTGRPDTGDITSLKPEVVEMTTEHIFNDIRPLVDQRCKTRRITYRTKRKMEVKLAEKADGKFEQLQTRDDMYSSFRRV